MPRLKNIIVLIPRESKCVWQNSSQKLRACCVLSVNVGKSLCVESGFSLKPSRCFYQTEIWRNAEVFLFLSCVSARIYVCVCVNLLCPSLSARFYPNHQFSCEVNSMFPISSTPPLHCVILQKVFSISLDPSIFLPLMQKPFQSL